MLKLLKYTNEYREPWNEFVRDNNGTVFHRIEWKEILEQAFGYEAIYYMAVDDCGRIVGLLPVVAGKDLLMRKVGASLPFVNYMDICCTDAHALDFILGEVEKITAAHGLKHLEIRLKEQEFQNAADAVNDTNYTLVIPLDGDEEQVLGYSSGSNRNHVRKVYKNNYFSVSYDRENLPRFYDVYCKTMKRLGSPAPHYNFFKGVLEKLPQNTALLTAIDNESGQVVGGMFLFTYGDTVFYQWGGSLTEYNKKYINNFLYWETAKFGLKNGYKQLDLGRSPYESGTYKFKLQWGAVPKMLKYYKIGNNISGTEINKENMGFFISTWKVLPEFVTNISGPILIKYVMP